MFLSAVPNWVYGRNMLEQLAYEDVLVQFKKRYFVMALSPFLARTVALIALECRVEEDPRLFQSLIQRLLLSNPHRVSLHMYPDPSMAVRRLSARLVHSFMTFMLVIDRREWTLKRRRG